MNGIEDRSSKPPPRDETLRGEARGAERPGGAAGATFDWGLTVVVGLVLGALVVVFGVAPVEAVMGFSQKIFYLHVPCGLAALLGFFVCLVGSVRYLASRNLRHDRLAASAAEVGLLFTTLVLVTGSLWARAAWGVWWGWDVRLTATAVLWCIYLGYLVLRGQVAERDRRARVSAVVGIVGFADVPLVYLSIRWWRTLHPQPVIWGPEGSGLGDWRMKLALAVSTAAVLAVFVRLLRLRVRLATLRDRSEGETL